MLLKRLLMLLTLIGAVSAGVRLVLKPNRQLDKYIGDSLSVQCQLVGPPDFTTSTVINKNPQWFFVTNNAEELIPPSGRKNAKLSEDHTILTITKAEPQDAGTYKCTATVDNHLISVNTQVVLYKPVQLNANEIQHPVEGQIGRIFCRAENAKELDFSWSKKIGSAANEFEPVTLSNGDSASTPGSLYTEENGQVLVINDFNKERDDGTYLCTVRLIEMASFTEKTIDVIGYTKPTITHITESVLFNEGSQADLSCTSIGYPAVNFTWFKGGDELQTGDIYTFPEPGLLRILKIVPTDAGQYSCMASNEVGTDSKNVTVSVYLKPVIVSINNGTARKGDRTEIGCQFVGDEPLSVSWYSKTAQIPSLEDNPDSQNQDIYTVMDKETKSLVLHFKKPHTQNSGDYQCRVSNKAGEDSRTVFFNVEHKPEIVDHSSDVTRAVNTTYVELFCKAEAIPLAHWEWKVNDSPITNSDDVAFVVSADQLTSTLKIKHAAGHFGVYVCKAENTHGDAKFQMSVLKIELPVVAQPVMNDVFPTKARIYLEEYTEGKVSESNRPTKIEIKSIPAAQYTQPFDWNTIDATTVTYEPSGYYDLHKLVPSVNYKIAVRGLNEAGASEWLSADYRTAKPEVPSSPVFKTENNSECLASLCKIEWFPVEDGGSIINNFIVKYGVFRDNREGPMVEIVINANAISSHHFELKALHPETTYILRMYADNNVGISPASPDLFIKTRKFTLQDVMVGGINAGAIVAIIVIVVLILVLLIDVACYYVNQCGLLMCFCVNCCGKTPPDVKAKEFDLEQGINGKTGSDEKKPLREISKENADQDEHAPMINKDKNSGLKRDTTV